MICLVKVIFRSHICAWCYGIGGRFMTRRSVCDGGKLVINWERNVCVCVFLGFSIIMKDIEIDCFSFWEKLIVSKVFHRKKRRTSEKHGYPTFYQLTLIVFIVNSLKFIKNNNFSSFTIFFTTFFIYFFHYKSRYVRRTHTPARI